MLTSKWHTLIFKRCKLLGKSGENELDVMKRARTTYREEDKGKSFAQEDAWEILKLYSKWDAPKWKILKLYSKTTFPRQSSLYMRRVLCREDLCADVIVYERIRRYVRAKRDKMPDVEMVSMCK
ncbi:hypothetical protein Tco_0769975 [Tanacetum coccineum]|uniref:Uncharacterized protein n=1 Tax=Tanacetum coccineum TaxID=301880 RepID=A0ABQ4ZAW0_9ASTR